MPTQNRTNALLILMICLAVLYLSAGCSKSVDTSLSEKDKLQQWTRDNQKQMSPQAANAVRAGVNPVTGVPLNRDQKAGGGR